MGVPVHGCAVDVDLLSRKLISRHALVRERQVGLEQADNGGFISGLDADALKIFRPYTVVMSNARSPAVGRDCIVFGLNGVDCDLPQEGFQPPERVGLRVVGTFFNVITQAGTTGRFTTSGYWSTSGVLCHLSAGYPVIAVFMYVPPVLLAHHVSHIIYPEGCAPSRFRTRCGYNDITAYYPAGCCT